MNAASQLAPALDAVRVDGDRARQPLAVGLSRTTSWPVLVGLQPGLGQPPSAIGVFGVRGQGRSSSRVQVAVAVAAARWRRCRGAARSGPRRPVAVRHDGQVLLAALAAEGQRQQDLAVRCPAGRSW